MNPPRRYLAWLVACSSLVLLLPLAAGQFDDATELNRLAPEFQSLYAAGRYREAEPYARRVLAIAERSFRGDAQIYSGALNNLANVLDALGNFDEAASLHRQALGVREQRFGPQSLEAAESLGNLAVVYLHQGRYGQAEPLFRRSLEILKRRRGPEHPEVAACLNNLGVLALEQGEYSEAEQHYQQALAIKQRALQPDHLEVALALSNLATVYDAQGRYDEAEELLQQALRIRQKKLRANHPDVASTLENLGVVHLHRGRYAEAEPLLRRALELRQESLDPSHLDISHSLNNLGIVCAEQQRYADAEKLYRRALLIRQERLPPEHPDIAASLNNLAVLYKEQGRYAEAEPLYKRVLRFQEAAPQRNPHALAVGLNNLASLYEIQGDLLQAEPLYQRALEMWEEVGGPNHPDVARALNNLANLYFRMDRQVEAERMVERALAIREQGSATPDDRFQSDQLRARIAARQGRLDQAVADMERALEQADRQRQWFSGDEASRAKAAADYSAAADRLMSWYIALGMPAEALAAADNDRARLLAQQIELQGSDPLAGVPYDEARQLRNRQNQAQARVASLEKQLELVWGQSGLSSEERSRQITALEAQLTAARQEFVDAYGAVSNASPAHRRMSGGRASSPALGELQQWLAESQAVLLYYSLADEGAWLFVVTGSGTPRAEPLQVSGDLAGRLGLPAGPLTEQRTRQALEIGNKTVLQWLARPALDAAARQRLSDLWQILVPAPEREALTSGQYRRLVIVPDGALLLFPFEALVVDQLSSATARANAAGLQDGRGEDSNAAHELNSPSRGLTPSRSGELAAGASQDQEPTYLLDAGPPVLYAPSASMLYDLACRSALPGGGRGSVLTVSNPQYGALAELSDVSTSTALDGLAARFRYRALGGGLPPLPYSGLESRWVKEVFAAEGVPSEALQGGEATEGRLRAHLSRKRILHLACHGLVDQQYGNLFGALALTPGQQAAVNPADDGFLTLAEVYELDLTGCELAILSACQTNYGPQQRGEGVWALSRGFLVAGSRRVVASNWLVDDEAAASLISYFCGGIAKGEKAGQLDYARSLHEAKRWVRQQEKWKSPYYWGTFVLVGPN